MRTQYTQVLALDSSQRSSQFRRLAVAAVAIAVAVGVGVGVKWEKRRHRLWIIIVFLHTLIQLNYRFYIKADALRGKRETVTIIV